MKVSLNNYKSLKALETGNIFDAIVRPEFLKKVGTAVAKEIVEGFTIVQKQHVRRFFVTEKFYSTVDKATTKLMQSRMYEDCPPDCGVLITNFGWTLYLINPNENDSGDIVRFIGYHFTKEHFVGYTILNLEGKYGGYFETDPNLEVDTVNLHLITTLSIVTFLHLCEVETKEIKSGGKTIHNKEKYINETKRDFTVLDCAWFTELIAKSNINVGGHLRWQAHGEKFSKRKLIYIEPYEKTYHRKAKKDTTL